MLVQQARRAPEAAEVVGAARIFTRLGRLRSHLGDGLSVLSGASFGSPTAFAVNKNAKNAAWAKEFIKFATGEEGALVLAGIGVVPAYSSDAVTAAFTALPGDELSKTTFTEDKKVVLEMPVSDKTSDIDTILNEEHQLIMTGQKSIDDGIREAGDRVKNEVL